MCKKPPLSRKAFSLIEILVTVSIIAVLAALLFPSLESMKRAANRTACASHLRAMGGVWTTYANDHDGNYPSNGYVAPDDNFGNWNTLRGNVVNELFEGGYAGDSKIFFCPSATVPKYLNLGHEHANPGGLYSFSYDMYCGQLVAESSNEQLNNNLPPARNTKTATSKTPLMFDDTPRYSAEGFTLANHYNKNTLKPYGGNVVFCDGHVEWRPFSSMIMVMNSGGVRRYY
jgi:prepilin-type N-terminal cleavage/methylation domain-containing protein/prepilin-type processing-associated H-X9-DG protein